MAIISVFIAYSMNCIPGVEQKEIDKILVNAVERVVCYGRQKSGQDRFSKRKKYEEPFERFLMSLADQQVVTSFAMIIAAISKWTEISLYSFAMAWSMAVVSLVTHLAILRFCPK